MRMSFGKFSGYRLDELPDWYLEWILNQGWLREPLLSACRAEVLRRDGHPATTPADDETRAVASQIIAAGYRKLAHERHPDKGGSHQAMLALNQAHEWVRQKVGV